MEKTFLYRLFRIGKIPEPLLSELTNEGIVLIDEGVPGSVTYRNFRTPWRWPAWRRKWYTASIALTKVRLLALQYSRPVINVPFADERIKAMQYSVENGAVFCIAFDAALFHTNWSGRIEYRFRTPQAQRFLKQLQHIG